MTRDELEQVIRDLQVRAYQGSMSVIGLEETMDDIDDYVAEQISRYKGSNDDT